jgi:hypothetical protein
VLQICPDDVQGFLAHEAKDSRDLGGWQMGVQLVLVRGDYVVLEDDQFLVL